MTGIQCPFTTSPTHVLVCCVLNEKTPLNVNHFRQIFEKTGGVEKIHIFTKQGTKHALIQFTNVALASKSRQTMNNREVYSGCDLLKIEFSTVPQVRVDPGNPNDLDLVTGGILGAGEDEYGYPINPSGRGGGPVRSEYSRPDSRPYEDRSAYRDQYRDRDYGGRERGSRHDDFERRGRDFGGDEMGRGRGRGRGRFSDFGGRGGEFGGRGFRAPFGGGGRFDDYGGRGRGGRGTRPKTVVSITNVPPATPLKHLFTLCSVWANVERVWIPGPDEKEHGKAFVQFKEEEGAWRCCDFMNDQPLFGPEPLECHPSGIPAIVPNSDKNIEDFIESGMHRIFRNLRHLARPSRFVFLTQLPPEITQGELEKMAEEFGDVSQVLLLEVVQTEREHGEPRRTAILEAVNLETSARLIIGLHNYKCHDRRIKATFSQYTCDEAESFRKLKRE